ncbi:hypothetical protein Avbf_13742 [Armadillidium vulgare]|nr:hypothetical protein Avbf_13742 [Armadillidium vulgare]
MLPSMCSPMESESFPPDICYSSGEANTSSPPTWVKSACESQSVENVLDTNDDDNSTLSKETIVAAHSEDCLEGAVGGILPDLCNTGGNLRVLSDSVSDENESYLPKIETHEESIHFEVDNNQSSSSTTIHSESVSEVNIGNICVSGDSSSVVKKYEDKTLNHKNINLLPCETGDLDNKRHCTLESKESLSSIKSESLPCGHDPYGALKKGESEEKSTSCVELGLDLVRKNVLHSSHPSFHEWKCSAVIPSYLLSPVSLHSHGTSLGYNVRTSIDLSGSSGRSSMGSDRETSEDEQIKMAKKVLA